MLYRNVSFAFAAPPVRKRCFFEKIVCVRSEFIARKFRDVIKAGLQDPASDFGIHGRGRILRKKRQSI